MYSHGIDSLNCTLASLCETAAMGLGASKSGVFTALIPCLPMFFSTWETYHTHTLYLGYFNGPTGTYLSYSSYPTWFLNSNADPGEEGLILACTIMVTSGYYGPEVWTYRITSLV